MNYEEKKEKLGGYLFLMKRLTRVCREAALWRERAGSTSQKISPVRGAGDPKGIDVFIANAIEKDREAEQLAEQVNLLRRELENALEQMRHRRYRELLECLYIDGTDIRDLGEEWNYSRSYMNQMLRLAINELDDVSAYFS